MRCCVRWWRAGSFFCRVRSFLFLAQTSGSCECTYVNHKVIFIRPIISINSLTVSSKGRRWRALPSFLSPARPTSVLRGDGTNKLTLCTQQPCQLNFKVAFTSERGKKEKACFLFIIPLYQIGEKKAPICPSPILLVIKYPPTAQNTLTR